MRATRPLAFAAAAIVLLAASHSQAAATDAFDVLVPELRIREAGLEGQTDPVSLRQLRAVQRSLDVIERADTLALDCRAAGRATGLLARAFSGEFVASPPFAAELSDFVGDVYQRLVDHVFVRRTDLEQRILGLPEPVGVKVQRALDDADVWIHGAFRARSFRATARLLERGAAAIARGMRIADAEPIKK